MTKFTGGPAQGVILNLARAPLFLRVTHAGGPTKLKQGDGFDALDQLTDAPGEEERVWAYRKASDDGNVHVDYRDEKGRRRGAWYAMATYAYLPEQPAEDVMRDNALWRAWCVAKQKEGENVRNQ